MTAPRLPDPEELAAALDPAELRALMLLQLALPAGALLFLGVVLGMPLSTGAVEADPDRLQPPLVFSAVHALLTLGVWAAAAVVPAAQLRQAGRTLRERAPTDARTLAAAWMAPFRAARIVTLGLLEGTALFGVGLLFLARTAGSLEARPELWAHLLPLGVFLAWAAGSLPTAEAVGRAWRRHVLEAPP